MRLSLLRLLVVLTAVSLAAAPVAQALAISNMADSPAMAGPSSNDDCGGCAMDHGKAVAACTAMCGVAAAIVAVTSPVLVMASAPYPAPILSHGPSRAPPPDFHPPKHLLAR